MCDDARSDAKTDAKTWRAAAEAGLWRQYQQKFDEGFEAVPQPKQEKEIALQAELSAVVAGLWQQYQQQPDEESEAAHPTRETEIADGLSRSSKSGSQVGVGEETEIADGLSRSSKSGSQVGVGEAPQAAPQTNQETELSAVIAGLWQQCQQQLDEGLEAAQPKRDFAHSQMRLFTRSAGRWRRHVDVGRAAMQRGL